MLNIRAGLTLPAVEGHSPPVRVTSPTTLLLFFTQCCVLGPSSLPNPQDLKPLVAGS